MAVWIHRIETTVPENRYSQAEIGMRMLEWTAGDRDRRLVKALYRNSGIETRHSVISDAGAGFFNPTGEGGFHQPGTAARNAIYSREATRLALGLGQKLLAASPGFAVGEVTHLVTASCTGFFNPGIDYFLCRELGLPANTQRFHLGFMGCYAAFPALNMAVQFCRANPDAVVLVMCLELCSLHLQVNANEDTILANSLFADGAAALLVSARTPRPGSTVYRVQDFDSALLPAGREAMAWSIGDFGFDIALSSYVPKIIGSGISDLIQPLLARNGMSRENISRWAVHPGGKSIIDRVAKGLDLAPEQVSSSRTVLREFGNMSSATILFVLKEMLAATGSPGAEKICAMAFGPGLTVEAALLQIEGGENDGKT